MKAKITSEILKEHFDCAHKTYLKLKHECGEKTEFQKLLYEKEKKYRLLCIDHLCRKKFHNNNSSKKQDINELINMSSFVRYRQNIKGPITVDWRNSPIREEDILLVVGKRRKMAFVDKNWNILPYEYKFKKGKWEKRDS